MFAVAIDGPSGVGKSSVSKAVAKLLGFVHVDSGALYRTIALHILETGVDPENASAMKEALEQITIQAVPEQDGQQMLLCGRNVTGLIRSREVSDMASRVAKIPQVREYLLQMQRNMAESGNVIMDGRDIGTVVLPDAQVKIFLTASAEERATRRYNELLRRGAKAEYVQILAEVKARDQRDVNREISPLKPAEDAVLVDSTPNVKAQTVEIIKNIILEKMAKYTAGERE